jgi:phosphodiesterase/alkaline phosphatase D-like protein
MLDERSYRGANSPNRQEAPSTATAFLGMPQLRWLKRALLASNATWKVIASDMPLGLLVPDVNGFEAWANGDGPALGRELELASLLASIKANDIANVVWLTADVHYAAAHYYDPAKAQFTNFKPFWNSWSDRYMPGPSQSSPQHPGSSSLLVRSDKGGHATYMTWSDYIVCDPTAQRALSPDLWGATG